MKKILLLIISIVLVLALVACGGDSTCTEHTDADSNGKCDTCGATVEPENGGNEGGSTNADDLVLVKDGATNFAVVTAMNSAGKLDTYVNNFIANLNRYYLADKALKLNYDAPGFDDVIEIIFGSPSNRGDQFKRDEHYRIPYRALLPKETDNMLVAGRCLSADHEAHSAVRIMPICACLGEAAGIAAAVAKQTETNAHTLDVKIVQEKLIANGGIIH